VSLELQNTITNCIVNVKVDALQEAPAEYCTDQDPAVYYQLPFSSAAVVAHPKLALMKSL